MAELSPAIISIAVLLVGVLLYALIWYATRACRGLPRSWRERRRWGC